MVNCCVPGCTVARTSKWQGVSIFKIPQRKNEFYSKWRKSLVDVINRYRELKPTYVKGVLECTQKMYICEKHFDEKDLYFTPENKKFLNDDALPNPAKLPVKSFVTEVKERKPPKTREVILNEEIDSSESLDVIRYGNLDEMLADFNKFNSCCIDMWCSAFTRSRELRLFLSRDPQFCRPM